MKILVTGGAGFIASHVVDRYLAAGHDVVVVDDLSTGQQQNLNPAAKLYRLDLCESDELERVVACERPDVINHHAAQMDVRRSVREPLFDARVNVLGSLGLLELAVRYPVRKFIYASTGGAIYGEPARVPVDEGWPAQPISHYGVSKQVVERYLHVYERLYGLRFTVLRYANVYGPRQNPFGEAGVVAIFILQMLEGTRPTIFGGGSKTRDYVFVDDAVEANLRALERGDGEVFNLGWGIPVTDDEIFEAVRRAVGYTGTPNYAPRRAGEVEQIALDARRAETALGWVPRVHLDEGLARTVEYVRSGSRLSVRQ